MTKKNIFLLLLLAGLGAIYVVYFTNLFSHPEIQISARTRIESSRRGKPETVSVSFNFDQKVLITDLKVVAVKDAETNKYPRVFWNLVADTNAVPLRGLAYGEVPKGMKTKVAKINAQPLQPNTAYRLLVEAGARRGQVDFEIPNARASR